MNDKLKVFIQTKGGKRTFIGSVTHLRSISLLSDVPATLNLIAYEITYYLPAGLRLETSDGMNFSAIRINVKGK